MDKMSDLYVHHMFLEQNPTIRRNGFNILRSYIGAYVLPQEKYNEFELSEKLESALKELGATKDNINQVSLIEFENGIVNLEEFIFWYRNRSQYIKFNKESLSTYSKNLENLIWRMLRDKLLSEEALRRGFDQTESFKKQSGWWKDKIVYSSVRNEIIESVALKIDEINIENRTDEYDKDISEKKRIEIMRKFLTKLNELKINYQININHKVLNRIPVSDENNPKAVDFYTVKKGSLIPRPAYPTIDFEWINWE
jgi:putative ubiquitin-RnfH superfamily antitoxin RatB of RatAB toxin-antitoxin module/RNase P/RNase MRP subunit POP5